MVRHILPIMLIAKPLHSKKIVDYLLTHLFICSSVTHPKHPSPLIAWTHGAQMVAFNMQGYGRSFWLMHGMFWANGGCGYVNKPDFLLKAGPHNEVFDPETALPTKTTLKIGIAGVRADTVMKKTKTLKDNWIPNWNEKFEFPLTVPELALL
ncbi:hypothetical protein POM88_053519 [Heracleum sosnowskyi]|uniref:PI-PLC Y-box domain-containing protein n=1 Tax=Heracleum sosnowskyi TaxID=360622 RepID=A0AAD8GQ99_9APIA|nr:hypothetical protein POM88_053519 [Heracleum sosnowskyi]